MAPNLLKRTAVVRAFAAVTLACGGLRGAQAQQAMLKPTVAIMEIPSNAVVKPTEFAALSAGMQMLLTYAMKANPEIRLVERKRIQEVLAEQNLATNGRVSPEQAAKAGRILGAGHMLMGELAVFSMDKVVLTVNSVNSETSEVELSEQVVGKSDKVLELIDQIASKLNAKLKLPGVRDPKDVKEQGLSGRNQLEAAQAYTAALHMEEKGDISGAIVMYQKVVQLNPEFGIAKSSLAALEKQKRH